MTGDFKIAGIRIHNPPIPGNGQRTLASVTVETDVFIVSGISLIETDAGERFVYLPRFVGRARVILRSTVGFPALLEAVQTAYRALGGASAETPFAPASSVEHHHADHP